MIFNFISFFLIGHTDHTLTQKTEKGARGTNENMDTDFNNSKQTNKHIHIHTDLRHTYKHT